jgi:DNA-binding response OmpR family regulator
MQTFAHSPDSGGARAPAVPGRVLIVDDDREAALFAVHALTRRGRFEVTCTPDPAVALALVATEPWDLVLTDLDLPVISGIELIAAFRALAPRLPVLLITSRPRATIPDAARYHPDGLLVKPVSADEMHAAAVALVDRTARPRTS